MYVLSGMRDRGLQFGKHRLLGCVVIISDHCGSEE